MEVGNSRVEGLFLAPISWQQFFLKVRSRVFMCHKYQSLLRIPTSLENPLQKGPPTELQNSKTNTLKIYRKKTKNKNNMLNKLRTSCFSLCMNLFHAIFPFVDFLCISLTPTPNNFSHFSHTYFPSPIQHCIPVLIQASCWLMNITAGRRSTAISIFKERKATISNIGVSQKSPEVRLPVVICVTKGPPRAVQGKLPVGSVTGR